MLCVEETNGYRLECSDRLIPFEGMDFSLLSTEEFAELRNTKVSMVSMVKLKSTVLGIDTKIDGLTETLKVAISNSYAIKKQMELDHSKCPVSPQNIIEIVDEWYRGLLKVYADPKSEYSQKFTARTINDVNNYYKEKLFTVSNVLKALGVIVGATVGVAVAIVTVLEVTGILNLIR